MSGRLPAERGPDALWFLRVEKWRRMGVASCIRAGAGVAERFAGSVQSVCFIHTFGSQ
jgi:hypothetical protein